MLSRSFSLFALILGFGIFLGCSGPESSERLDTVFCWLRPSCLPSQPPTSKAPAKPTESKRSPTKQKPQQVQNGSPKKDPPPCLTPTETTISASKSDIRISSISYNEPTTQADGKTLTDLDKTSIYFYRGNKRIKLLKECAATNIQGGGRIPEGGGRIPVNIPFPIREGAGLQAKICVTATDRGGNEGSHICKPIKK